MSRDYVERRLSETGAPPPRVRRPRGIAPSQINFSHPTHKLANQYIRKMRKKYPSQPSTWFDVHDAFVAGWNAAKGVIAK